MEDKPIFAAMNTLKAGWLELILAMLFGEKRVAEDSGVVVTMYKWRGKLYLTDFKEAKR